MSTLNTNVNALTLGLLLPDAPGDEDAEKQLQEIVVLVLVYTLLLQSFEGKYSIFCHSQSAIANRTTSLDYF